MASRPPFLDARVALALVGLILAACSEERAATDRAGDRRELTITVASASSWLTATAFGLEPTGASVAFDCDGSAVTFHFVPTDPGNGTWTFAGTVPRDCASPAMVAVKFRRADAPAAGARTVANGLGYVRDPLGGATYRLDDDVLTIDYWGDAGAVDAVVSVDHDARFASHGFTFTPGHSCPIGQSGTLRLSGTSDRFTITMPHDPLTPPTSMTGTGDAGFIGPATDNGSSIDYVFSFETLAPNAAVDYAVTVSASWPDPPNPDAHCGGELTFRLVKRHFSLYEALQP